MRIWVIGADLLARALGRSWGQAGHQVLFTFGDHTDWDALAAETGGRVGTLAEGATAEVVLLAAPWATVGKALRTAGSLAGKVVLDATNPHQPMVGASGAEQGLGKVRACLVGDDGVIEPARPPAIVRAPRSACAGPAWRSTLRWQRRSWTPSSHVSRLDALVRVWS
jgi:NADP oxidoreductase coenzyme F420-dependent